MRHHIFEESSAYPVALLAKGSAFNKQELVSNYVMPLNQRGVASSQIIAFTLEFDGKAKPSAKTAKEYLNKLLPALDSLGTTHLYVTDSTYFKILVGQSKAEPHHGYAMPCKIKGFDHMTVVLGLNYQALIYNPDLKSKLDMGLDTVASSHLGKYSPLGQGILHSAHYPKTLQAIAEALKSLHQYPSLTCDIEGFSLRFNECGIGTIAFAWDEHNGVAFACDYKAHVPLKNDGEQQTHFGLQQPNEPVRALLLEFFELSLELQNGLHNSN